MAEYDDDMLLENFRELLRNRPTGSRSGPRPKQDEFKISELPEFTGGTNPENYLEWERKIERMFDFKDLNDEKRCRYAILRLSKGASLWFEGLKAKRARAGKDKVASWESLKRKLRKRYVPTTHRITTYRKIAEFKQGKLSVGEYIDEFENLSLMGELEEIEEQKMARFLRGLNFNISSIVELYPYSDFDTLCGLCLKLESQGKSKYGGGSGTDYGESKTWAKPESPPKFDSPASSSNPGKTHNSNTTTPKTTNAAKETSLSKVRCFKCQGFGHYQNSCPNKRVVTLREALENREELCEEDETRGGVFNLDEPKLEAEQAVIYEAPSYDTCLVIRSLQVNSEPNQSEQRVQLFYTKCQVNDKWCSVIIDGGSCTNAASSEMVSKIGLPTTAHPEPYALHWLNDGKKVQVTKQVRVCFAMGSYKDEVVCDVVPMDACHVLLGRPWQYDRDVLHRGRSNEYELMDDGKRVVLRPMSAEATGALRSKGKKHSSLTMLTVGRFGKDVLCGDNIDSSLDFNLPPIWDLYDDEGAENALAKEPCPSCKSGQQLGVVVKPSTLTIDANKFLVHKICDLVEFQVPRAAAVVQILVCSMSLYDSMVREALSMLVHGGRWGGRHKDAWKSKGRIKLQPGHGDGSSSLFGYVISFALSFIFYPGEFKHLELRSVPFKGGGDDPDIDEAVAFDKGELVEDKTVRDNYLGTRNKESCTLVTMLGIAE